MQIIISPAKKMRTDTDSFDCQGLPVFVEQARQLAAQLQQMTLQQLQALWKCNDKILQQNIERLQRMDLYHQLTPAILAYDGIQYQYMAPGVFTDRALEYIQKHLRILSGLYGILRPFDGVTPYRLEMQAKLAVDGCRDLYQFWGSRLARQLASETDVVLNLASKEYSKAVEAYLPKTVRFVTCAFGELKDGRVVEKGTKCKMARGQMVRWLAENQIKSPEDLRAFDQLGYQFCRSISVRNHTVFLWIQSPKD